MHRIENLNEIHDLQPVALDFIALLKHPDNVDIAGEFPGSVARYSGELDEVVENLQNTQNACRPGKRQQFVAFVGERAVGIAAVQTVDDVPENIDPSWPNLSGLICRPYRRQGLGKLSLQTRLQVVQEQFGGDAWTKVKRPNHASRHMVLGAGFQPVSVDDEAIVYAYHAPKY